ncbi:hypothetical protein CSR02_05305 [Acetobacter pomorum]|uniref:Uncharacterized protein n=2 Tax=Acetobacter pomorum TaxID=65959 RepID=A0A2G4RDK4_9PROT|nr:hypothetical protein CSR02_05305 [Acetobacter pomorum]
MPFLFTKSRKKQLECLLAFPLGWRMKMRVPFTNHHALPVSLQTKKQVEQNNVPEKIMERDTRTEPDKTIKPHNLLDKKYFTTTVKTRKSLFRK